ncbi:ABC-type dipeptide/oligopeptide/nickel transport system ATPase subunit [Arthrobacter ginsengisoli]|uniref:ABC-type dipeptide/oligopeptide/nickel transport system ATPase subunit n=1 Tax=Arthrobacter ginsengisoli TaxID=1356565 RepID=A0ABU1UI16_9MICC|nr:ABC transporter ATP-binding protein [Arthrobacter ginsengisoli]MDR7084842.1 ABC-type dipeptide/oligopeptide/nickel transport system ATPase subunit [Arthrobacter ginsengisoli]
MQARKTILDVTDLSIVHPGRRGRPANTAVKKLNLTAGAGEIVGVVGESGSGKTSLAMAVVGFGRITSGSITVDAVVPGPRMSLDERASIQMVFQDPHGSLDPRQTIGSGLDELRKLHKKRTSWISDEDLLSRVGLSTEVLTRLSHQISGGQAQRVSIARALLLRPSLLLADEPTSALDVSVQAQILRLLKNLRDNEGLTILFISHDLAVVRAVCDRVYVMKTGEVVEFGSTHEVLEHPKHPYTQALLAAVPGGGIRRETGHGPQTKAGPDGYLGFDPYQPAKEAS